MTIDVHPEFGVELVLATPYIYWLHKNDKLDKIICCKDMKPFYYFCDDIEEKYTERSIHNELAGLSTLPNSWLHHNSMANFGKNYGDLTEKEQVMANGTLDYSQWTPPPLKQRHKNDRFIFDKPIVVINNSFNIEAGSKPTRYFSIECLYEMFTYLTDYTIIYRRPTNKELPTIDQNEANTIGALGEIEDNVEGIGLINDYQLTEYFDHVILFDELHQKNGDLSYNEFQCMLYANCDKFISYVGGGGILSSYFGGTNIMWTSRGKEVRDGYLDKNSYYHKLSDCKVIPIFDKEKTYPHRIENYHELLETIRSEF